MGFACVPDFMAESCLADGTLKEMLTDRSSFFDGFHLYFPNRRQTSPAFSAFVEAMRFYA